MYINNWTKGNWRVSLPFYAIKNFKRCKLICWPRMWDINSIIRKWYLNSTWLWRREQLNLCLSGVGVCLPICPCICVCAHSKCTVNVQYFIKMQSADYRRISFACQRVSVFTMTNYATATTHRQTIHTWTQQPIALYVYLTVL